MLKAILLATFAILPLVYSSVLTDEELKALAQKVLRDAGFLYKLPEGDQQRFFDYARENKLNYDTVKGYFKSRGNTQKSKSPRVTMLPDLLGGKKIRLGDWGARLTKIYDVFAEKDGANAMRMFINKIANIIVADKGIPIDAYAKPKETELLRVPVSWFEPQCKTVTTDEMFKNDTETLLNTAKTLLDKCANAKELILEEVVVGVLEVLRITPCVLESTDYVEDILGVAINALSIPREKTIFDPLPGMLKKIEEDAKFESHVLKAIPSFKSVAGNKQNAMIRFKRFLDSVVHDSQSVGDLIMRFIRDHDFYKGSIFHNLKIAIEANKAGYST